MKRFAVLIIVMLISVITLHGADKNQKNQAQIARALSAAPASIAAEAAVVTMEEHGGITELRPGTNGWTCLPNDPGTPLGHPLCLDKNGLAWMQAAMSGHVPAPDKTGYSYMLQGGSSWSNLDVTAIQLPAGQKKYITIPPHVMVMNSKIAEESGFPSGEAYPDTNKPFVMYGGTPFAILMIPIHSSKENQMNQMK